MARLAGTPGLPGTAADWAVSDRSDRNEVRRVSTIR